MNNENKMIIYQVFTRLFETITTIVSTMETLPPTDVVKWPTSPLKALGEIKKLGATHIWYTGIIEHATETDYRRYNIRPDHPAIVKVRPALPTPSRIIMT